MTIEQLIEKANDAHAERDLDSAMSYLKEAGSLGSMHAALDYAYHFACSNPAVSIEYLDTIPDSHNPVVQYHQLLIGYFGSLYNSSGYIVEKLLALAKSGVVEASIVLLSYLPVNTPEFTFVAKILQSKSPNIYKQLGVMHLIDTVSKEPSENDVLSYLKERFIAKPESPTVVSNELPLLLHENVLSTFECNYMVTRFSPMLKPSMVVDPDTGKGLIDSIRTSYVATIEPHVTDWITRKIDNKIAQLTDTSVKQGEALSLSRYQPGQEYKAHYDVLGAGQGSAIYKDGGQRIKTALIYLNTVEDGGCTAFPKLDLKITPTKGNMLVFSNTDVKGTTLLKSYHAGEKTISSNKWLVTKWIRESVTNYGSLIYGN